LRNRNKLAVDRNLRMRLSIGCFTEVLTILDNGHHPELCVKKRLFKEAHLRGYYRHRLFL